MLDEVGKEDIARMRKPVIQIHKRVSGARKRNKRSQQLREPTETAQKYNKKNNLFHQESNTFSTVILKTLYKANSTPKKNSQKHSGFSRGDL